MRFVFTAIFFFFIFSAIAQPGAVQDSSVITERSFSPSAFDEYKNDTDFQYQNELIERPSAWDRFWMWFWNWYEEIMSTSAGRTTMNIIYWVLGLSVIAFFIFRVMRMNKVALFANPSFSSNAYSVEDENIHAISFDAAIQDALQNGNYRLAIRLLYLQSLKIMADKNLIAWLPNKTNTDYLREVNNTPLRQSFKNVTYIFEYAWYGNLTVTADEYTEMKEKFSQFQSQL